VQERKRKSESVNNSVILLFMLLSRRIIVNYQVTIRNLMKRRQRTRIVHMTDDTTYTHAHIHTRRENVYIKKL
jgi:hypothetical protein